MAHPFFCDMTTAGSLLLENGSFLLLEDGSKLILG